jgi:single-strand DNA-binding protein
MASLNQITLIGNCTRDPELKHLQSGVAVCEIGLAVNEKYKSGNEWKEDVCFVDVSFFGRTAEVAGEYLAKGEPVCIVGKLKFSQWEKDGQKRSKHTVVADKMQLLSSRSAPPDDESQQETRQRPAPKAKPARQPVTAPPADEDCPF